MGLQPPIADVSTRGGTGKTSGDRRRCVRSTTPRTLAHYAGRRRAAEAPDRNPGTGAPPSRMPRNIEPGRRSGMPRRSPGGRHRADRARDQRHASSALPRGRHRLFLMRDFTATTDCTENDEMAKIVTPTPLYVLNSCTRPSTSIAFFLLVTQHRI
jgi:hypothetical protein